MKRITVNFTDEQWKIIEKFRGIMGNTESEIIRGLIMAYLSEKTYVKDSISKKGAKE